jgi:hypothetical protein
VWLVQCGGIQEAERHKRARLGLNSSLGSPIAEVW